MEFPSFMFFCFCLFYSSVALDTMAPHQTLRDNGHTLVSIDESFELGFFSPRNSDNRYIGIWFKNVPEQTVVWVANKDNPATGSSGVLTVTTTGNIFILDSQSELALWSSNSTGDDPVLQLLNTGNLVVRNGGKDSNSENYIWQSFDHPCDTMLPGMKLGSDLAAGRDWYLTSWKGTENPSTGEFTYRVDHQGLPQLVLRRGTEVQFRSGPWDGVRFGGGPKIKSIDNAQSIFEPIFVFNSTHVYYSFTEDKSVVSRFVLNQSGLLQHHQWKDGGWRLIVTLNNDICDGTYNKCGPYGICKSVDDDSICECPSGFTPKSPHDWNAHQNSEGCVARKPLNCRADDGFRKFRGMKLPDSSYLNTTIMSPADCEKACLTNCSCVAYARTDVSSCVVWFEELKDIRRYINGEGQDLHIRMAASQLDSEKTKNLVFPVMIVISSVILVGLVLSWYVVQKRIATATATAADTATDTATATATATDRSKDWEVDNTNKSYSQDIGKEDLELPLFDLDTIREATNNFSFANKIGQGGFGPVYKGKFLTGQEIAVKRLSEDSRQGLKEFKNEVILIAKLQHRNLVRLLGCCIHGEESMRIYEYMPNSSLDKFIFNQTRGTSLTWQKRFDIIVGIARGLLYLHQDSRLRIIHRDLKASNILLDKNMNPKISDFGLARTFKSDQTEVNTNRVIGTYGYMSPEYAIDGLYSVKSDVFSFGVLVLEIVSGRRNRGFCHPSHDLNLLGHAWKLWNEGQGMEVVDGFMEGPSPDSLVLSCIRVGLLCVQLRPEDRPSMASVLLMLFSNDSVLPLPKQPGFYTERYTAETESSSNEVTMTRLLGR